MINWNKKSNNNISGFLFVVFLFWGTTQSVRVNLRTPQLISGPIQPSTSWESDNPGVSIADITKSKLRIHPPTEEKKKHAKLKILTPIATIMILTNPTTVID